MNYFETFSIEPGYEISQDLVEQRYLELQKKYHPDNYQSAELQMQAAEKFMTITQAYETLKDKNLLLIHFLKVQGIELADSDIKGLLPQKDLEFLLEIQEKNINTKELVKQNLNFIRNALIHSVKVNNIDNIKINLARLSFFVKSLKNMK